MFLQIGENDFVELSDDHSDISVEKPLPQRDRALLKKTLALRLKSSLDFHQPVVKRLQAFRDHARASGDGNEVRVAVPARHNVDVQMILDTRAGGLAEVPADIETLRPHGFGEQSLRVDCLKTLLR